jgi:peroxiredoxin
MPAGAAPAPGKTAPSFTLRQLGGGTWALAAARGKVVLVSFWTPG